MTTSWGADAWEGAEAIREPCDCPTCGRDSCEDPEHLPAEAGNGTREAQLLTEYRPASEWIARPELYRPPEPVIPFLAWEERLSLLFAREKVGKSTLSRAGIAALTRGGEFLGQECRPGVVVYLNVEEHPYDTLKSLQDFRADTGTVLCGWTGPNPVQSLQAAVQAHRPRLVVVDALARLATLCGESLDSGSASAWSKFLSPFLTMAHDQRVAVLLLHHARKADDEYRDSTAIGATPDALVKMMKVKGNPSARRLETVGRGTFPDVVAILDDDGRGYQVADPMTRLRDQVAELAGRGLNGQEIAEELRVHKSTISRHLKALS